MTVCRSIKRIIFEATSRWDGSRLRALGISDIKQIAGRAGRYRTAADAIQEGLVEPANLDDCNVASSPKVGLVTSLERIDLPLIQRAMRGDASPIETAGILPPESLIMRFAAYFPPQTPFSYILLRLHEISRMHSRFHLCNLHDHVGVADAIQCVKELSVSDRLIFCASPASVRDGRILEALVAFAKCVGRQSGGSLLEIRELGLDILDSPRTTGALYLRQLESLHRALVLYLWLSYRFSGVFVSQAMAFHVKRIVEQRIDEALGDFTVSVKAKAKLKKLREKVLRDHVKEDANDSTDLRDHGITNEQQRDSKTRNFELEPHMNSQEASSERSSTPSLLNVTPTDSSSVPNAKTWAERGI